MGESRVGWWIGGTVFVAGLVLFAVGLATAEDGVTNTLALVGAFVALGGAGLGCIIDNWINDATRTRLSRSFQRISIQPSPKRKVTVYVKTGS